MDRLARLRVYGMLVLVVLFWAGNSIVGRAVHQDIPPFTLALARWTGAFVLLAPFAWPHLKRDWPVARRHWRVILLLGLLGVAAFNALLYSGLAHTTATNSLLIQAGTPALVLLLGLLLFRERPRFVQVLGVSLAALGAAVIVLRGDLAVLSSLRFGYGDVLIVCAVAIWAFYTVLLRLRPSVHALSFLALTFAIGALAMAGPALAEQHVRAVSLTASSMAGVAYVAVFPSLAAYFLYNKAVQEIGAADAGQMISLQPLLGAVLAWLFLREPLESYHATGMALIALGVAGPLLARMRRA